MLNFTNSPESFNQVESVENISKYFNTLIFRNRLRLIVLSLAVLTTSCSEKPKDIKINTATQRQELKSRQFTSKQNALNEYMSLKLKLDNLYIEKERAYKDGDPEFKDLQKQYNTTKDRIDKITYSE
jgi:phage protein D